MRTQLNVDPTNIMNSVVAHLALDTEKAPEEVVVGAAPRKHSQNVIKFAMWRMLVGLRW